MSVSKSRNMSLCIMCRNCFGNCAWSKHFKPVKGWTAVESYKKNGELNRAWIGWCPEFKPDRGLYNLMKNSEARKGRWHIQQEYGYITPVRYATIRYNLINNYKGVVR